MTTATPMPIAVQFVVRSCCWCGDVSGDDIPLGFYYFGPARSVLLQNTRSLLLRLQDK
jgi:hypothetical protein